MAGAALAHCGGVDGSTVDPNDCHIVNTCGNAAESGAPGADAQGADNTVPGDAQDGGPGQDAGEASPCSAPASLECNGTCVDPTLPANCGSCGHVCAGADGGQATCMAGGVCGEACDPASLTPVNCSGACVNVQTDPQHCGSCTVACPPPASAHGTATCMVAADGGGSCGVGCAAGYHVCMGDCLSNMDAPSVAGDPCIVSEVFGVFVSAGGSDTLGNGSRTMPYATLSNAMDKAAATGAPHRVYACATAGSFASETLTVGTSRDGVSVYGGFDCTTSPGMWTYNAAQKTTVAPPSGYALQVTGLTQGVTFDDFAFKAADATTMGGSSIAVFVANAKNVAFHRVAMTAGAGMAGAPGASGGMTGNPSNWFMGVLNGNAGTDTMAGPPNASCKCGDMTTSSIGGGGGSATQMPGPGLPGPPVYSGGAAGMNRQDCGTGGAGGRGIDAPVGSTDTASVAHGTLAGSGWVPAAGTPGSNGKVGQGGGGGGDFDGSGFGGGGACGGCGGAGGKSGGGGGSSIALLSYQSAVNLVGCTLTAGNAGAGGLGGDGEGGQSRGFGGVATAGCQGGASGDGSGGNGGQGGAGGLSLAIGYSGSPPTVDPTTASTVGSAGMGGAAGAAGHGINNAPMGAAGTKGFDGVMQTTPLAL